MKERQFVKLGHASEAMAPGFRIVFGQSSTRSKHCLAYVAMAPGGWDMYKAVGMPGLRYFRGAKGDFWTSGVMALEERSVGGTPLNANCLANEKFNGESDRLIAHFRSVKLFGGNRFPKRLTFWSEGPASTGRCEPSQNLIAGVYFVTLELKFAVGQRICKLELKHVSDGMGKRIRLSNGRRLVDDVIRMANQIPLAGLSGDFDFERVAKLRKMTRPKISWNVIFMKAYAQVCRKMPELMQGYSSFPWPHLYEHHEPVCMMTIAREYEGQERLFFARFAQPDNFYLSDLQAQYDHYRRAPIESIKQFRHQIKFAKAPSLVRRFAWWTLFNVWPEKRATHMGTYGMSISGYNGVYGSKHLGPNTTTLGVDPLARKGKCKLVLTFDHRVLDGTPASRVMQQLQHMMNSIICLELAEMVGADHRTGLPLNEAA